MVKRAWLVFVVIFAILLIGGYFLFFSKNSCNDGTLYDECSKIKPFFCSKGILMEKASVCGCDNLAEVEGDKCISEYQVGPKEIVLNYTLKGKEGTIDFTVYKKLYDYLSELPRYIDSTNGEATLLDFKLKSLNEEQQKVLLLPLVIEIENRAKNKDDQARIAVSIVQNIPFGSSDKELRFGSINLEYYRYPYEVLYDLEGVCGEKSELLAFLLRELGYENAFFYYSKENHEAMGIKCPVEKSLNDSGYCFIETTGPSIITDYKTEFVSIGQLTSTPEIITISGDSLTFGERNFYEYQDAKLLEKIRERAREYGTISYIQSVQFNELKEKYGL